MATILFTSIASARSGVALKPKKAWHFALWISRMTVLKLVSTKAGSTRRLLATSFAISFFTRPESMTVPPDTPDMFVVTRLVRKAGISELPLP